jgi:hypothetical protein
LTRRDRGRIWRGVAGSRAISGEGQLLIFLGGVLFSSVGFAAVGRPAMASRVKEDEKNERVIRGLLKLPANKRCINCNNLVRFPCWLRRLLLLNVVGFETEVGCCQSLECFRALFDFICHRCCF